MDKVRELKNNLRHQAKSQVPIQTEWVEVQSVDWEAKTMTGIGQENGLDYEDVLLGQGHCYKKPVKGALALIGKINNKAAAFLIDCEEVETILITDKKGFKIELNQGELTMNGSDYSIVKAEDLKSVMDQNAQFIDAFKQVLTGPPINEPGNGSPSALKTALQGALGQLQWGDHSEIENQTIKHGKDAE